ncbi:Transcription factor GT-2 [Handroanthus impetiginosus]|uniref:Transcription factor GT-2 n=1 Tax=Handroanthus impetiginosus TaxID=429701 RepID=A0A2G9HYY0_9LAMI|nr:Transcription factor GT-2 [Handroanthus impetiginosus]
MDLTMANQGGNNTVLRDYRKGNWTLQETMVLIEAKRMDDERRMKRLGDTSERGKPAELRWKWVEDYCWKKGCLRSQNQCNDKWDNLMRDFKKVREFERRLMERGGGEEKSYWRIEKNERKDNNLPSNMLIHIYEALVDVVERKGQRVAAGSGGAGSSSANAVVEKSTINVLGHHSIPPPMLQYPIIQPPTILLPPPPPSQTSPEPPILPSSQPLPASDSDTSEYSGSPAKRRKKRDGGTATAGVETSGDGATLQEVGSAISKSASIIAEAIQSCEEREERRHRELLRVHERRLQIEESKAEINRQGINGLVDAINKLANSILALAAHKSQSSSK